MPTAHAWLRVSIAYMLLPPGSPGSSFFFFQAEDGIRDGHVTGVQTCALPIWDGGRADVLRTAGSNLRVAVGGARSRDRSVGHSRDRPRSDSRASWERAGS